MNEIRIKALKCCSGVGMDLIQTENIQYPSVILSWQCKECKDIIIKLSD